MTSLPFALTIGSEKNVSAKPDSAAWEEEKEDILERANWLCMEIITDPESLMNKAPSMIGREYQGEWAIYCCSMLSHALTNITYLYPDKKDMCPKLIAKLTTVLAMRTNVKR